MGVDENGAGLGSRANGTGNVMCVTQQVDGIPPDRHGDDAEDPTFSAWDRTQQAGTTDVPERDAQPQNGQEARQELWGTPQQLCSRLDGHSQDQAADGAVEAATRHHVHCLGHARLPSTPARAPALWLPVHVVVRAAQGPSNPPLDSQWPAAGAATTARTMPRRSEAASTH